MNFCRFMKSFLEMQHCAGFLRPAVLRHIFAEKERLSGFKKAEIIAFDQIGIYAVIRSIVFQNIFRMDRFECVFQIQNDLAILAHRARMHILYHREIK